MSPDTSFSDLLEQPRQWTRHASHRTFAEAAQTWKLSPQPQRPFSFGLTKVNPADRSFTS